VHAEFSPAALADLEEIADYIARDDSKAAEVWVQRLLEAADRAAVFPHSGRVVPELRDESIREVLLRNYRIIYRVRRGGILVLTVIEGRRRLKLRR
jgi:addiction module RelE/StbE family toxin